jgi:phosphatidylserine/phosphatidylglycerophosphate/cardiolipin synthase-like enzyme
MIKPVLNQDHFSAALGEAIKRCRHRLMICTADVKNLHLPVGKRRAVSILRVLDEVADRHIEVRMLHSGVPSVSFLHEFKRTSPATLTMRRCCRVHAKAVIVDGRWMYLGSANLTGAGLGAKSARRRNFEAGICTDDVTLIDPVADMLDEIWRGEHCDDCGRRDHCPVPLEEPHL